MSLAGLDHLLLLYLERGQVHGQGESLVQVKPLPLVTALVVLTFHRFREVLEVPLEPLSAQAGRSL